MEIVIKVTPSELNEGLLDKIKSFIGEKKNIDVTISLKEIDDEYFDALNQSLEQYKRGEKISFTMEELMKYSPLGDN